MPSGSRPKTESAKARAASPESTKDERQHRIRLGTQWNSQLTKRAGHLGDSERLAACGQQGADSPSARAAFDRTSSSGSCCKRLIKPATSPRCRKFAMSGRNLLM